MRLSEIEQPQTADGRQVLKVEGRLCIIPKGMTAVELTSVGETIIGNLTPAVTFNHKIRLNTDVLALLTINTIVHESTHGFQEVRMGELGYDSTYFYQCGISFFRAGPTHIHDDHLLEREARHVGETIAAVWASVPLDVPLDIEVEIRKLMNW